MAHFEQWAGFKGKEWVNSVDVRSFIQENYTPYEGDESFLEGPTEATDILWGKLQELQKEERAKGGVLDMETEVVSGLTAYGPGYIDESMKDLEQVVGLQTDKPLKRAFMPYGGIKMAEQACTTYGYEPNPALHEIFTKYHKTHNQGVFDIYTPEMKKARHNKIITGLPDTYGRGRIVGDYRRVALYGIDFLLEKKQYDFERYARHGMKGTDFRLREELADQMRALRDMKEMAAAYGYDISQPAKDAKEAVQWLYFGYLAAIKTQNGAAMSVGRVSTFLDIYIDRDIKNGKLTEKEAQELIDHLVMKFRMVKFARIPSYNQLFSGDPVWATLEVGGLGMDGRSMVTKTDYRFLHTLENMGPGYPILQGVSNGYVCWQQDWNIYATSMDDGTTRKLTDVESGMMDPCGVYQGSLYGVDLSRGTLCRIDLGSGETETLWEAASDWQQGDAEGDQVRIDASIISANADMDGDRLYLEAVQTADDVQQYGYFCYELTTGELRELTTLDDSNTMLNIQNGNLYLLHTEMQENGDQVMELLCYDGETGELSVVMDHDQLAEISNIGSCSVASAASDGLYYIRNSAVPAAVGGTLLL